MLTDSSKTNPAKKARKTRRHLGQWGPVAAIVILILGMVLGEVFGAIIIGTIIGLIDPSLQSNLSTATEVQFLYVLMSGSGSLLILWLFLRWRQIKWREIGFKRKPIWRDLGWPALALPVYFLILIIVSSFAGAFLGLDINQEQEIGFDNVQGSISLLLTFVSLVVVPPFVEEILFRGFLYTGLRSKLKIWPAVIITSILFAIPHLFASSQGLLWIAAVDTFILSLFLCYLRERTGNLWASIALHAMKNGIAFFAIFVTGA